MTADRVGATEVAAVDEEHGRLLARIEDPFGNQWETGKPLVSWPRTGGHPGDADG